VKICELQNEKTWLGSIFMKIILKRSNFFIFIFLNVSTRKSNNHNNNSQYLNNFDFPELDSYSLEIEQ
jgi:hypothetical protein